MSRTVIDLDDDALAEAMRELGTTTKADTVNSALRLIGQRSRRLAAVERMMGAFSDPAALDGAWDEHKNQAA